MLVNANPVPYKPASLDTTKATLTTHTAETIDGKISGERTVASSDWAWAKCNADNPFPGTPDPTQICVKGGFDPKLLYQVVFTAQDPYVLGIGFAAFRDVAAFFRFATQDAEGTANPVANQALLIDNGSYSTYNALQLELRRRFSQGLFLSANYTYSKVLTDFEGSTTEISPLTTLRDSLVDKRRASYDIRNVFNLNAIYDLPFGPGQRWLSGGGVLGRIVGGWTASTIVRISSGASVSIVSGLGTFNQRTASNTIYLSPDLSVEQVQNYLGIFKMPYGVLFIDPNAPFMRITTDAQGRLSSAQVDTTKLLSPGAGQLGGLPLGAFSTPMVWNADIAVSKRTQIWEDVNLEIRGEFFNAFNTPTFSLPGTLTTSSTQFGVISSAGSRSIQISARLNF